MLSQKTADVFSCKELQMEDTNTNNPVRVVTPLLVSMITVGSLTALGAIFAMQARLRRASKPGRVVSSQVSPNDNPVTTFTRAGNPGDPINIQFLGTNGQLGAAFAAAGWYRADEIDFVTSTRICADAVFGRKYSTAPVSDLYLFGRKEDMAFERPGTSARQRDHIRIWNTGHSGSDSRPIWVGSVTKDTKVELAKTNHLPTHHISPDVDAERQLAISELAQTGFITGETSRAGFGKETHTVNGEGDPYFTDGQVAVLTLANVVTTPLATQVRIPLLARMTKQLAGVVRPWMPEAGRERAAREQAHLQASNRSEAATPVH
jgi:hypothetical protein